MYYLIIPIITLILDQLLKSYTVNNIPMGGEINIIPHFLSLTYVKNYGAAWSMMIGQQLLFSLISIVALVAIGYYFIKNKDAILRISLALLMGGIIGNWLDRLRFHYVVDMFQFKFIDFPIFNIADTAITIGVIILIAYLLFKKE
ncbi:MAG: signal peptidase II [Lactobacillus sp.]|nr:signal peptidase II [Lactobacillus sp.]